MDLSTNAKKVFDLVKDLTAVELAALVKSLEEEFGVTAASMVVAGGASAGGEDGDAGEAKDTFDVELTEIGQQKIAVIKAVKELMWVSLGDAKTLVEKAPTIIKTGLQNDEAEMFNVKLTEAGAVVTLK